MNAYETIFILKSSLTDEEILAATEKVKGVIQRAGGEVVASENWGKRKLAYEVKKEKRGTYIVVHLKGNGTTVLETERHFRLTESIMKFMLVAIDAAKLGQVALLKEEKPIGMRDMAYTR